MNPKIKIGMDYLEKEGLSHIQAAAVIGAFIVESNLNTHALGDKGLPQKAHGIGQWRGERWIHLQDLAKTRGKDPFDLMLQLEFALVELGTHEKLAGDKLFSADTIEEAVEAMIDYERPAGWTKKWPRKARTWKQRLSTARSLL